MKNDFRRYSQTRAILVLITAAFFSTPSFSEISCEMAKQRPRQVGGISPFWAQQLVGADFAREVAASGKRPALVGMLASSLHAERIAPEAHLVVQTNGQALAEQTEGSSGDKMANLIFSPIVGIAGNAMLMSPVTVGRRPNAQSLLEAADRFSTSRPKIIAVAQDLGDDEPVYKAFNALVVGGSILVLPAGDAFPRPVRDNAIALNAVRVGSISEQGVTDLLSQEDPMVDIAAPVGSTLQSGIYSGEKIEFENFSGTVAAVGLVTGAIANMMVFLPDLTPAEASVLVRRTAQATLNHREKKQRNGAGMLNAYKMVRVAKRLSETGWPGNRPEIMDPESKIYDFRDDAEAISRKIHSLVGKQGCEVAAMRVHLLRQSYLLVPDEKTREALITELTTAGLPWDAFFYSSLGPDFSSWILRALEMEWTRDQRLALVRAAGHLEMDEIPLQAFRDGISRFNETGEEGTNARMQVMVAMSVLYPRVVPWREYQTIPKAIVADLIEFASIMGCQRYVKGLIRAYSPRVLPLAAAVRSGQVEVAKLLLDMGADVNGVVSERNRSLLSSALNLVGNQAMVELLLERGIDINQMGLRGETALLLAIDLQDIRTVELLLTKGADPKIGTLHKKSAVELAQYKKNRDIVALICNRDTFVTGCGAPGSRALLASGMPSVESIH